MTKHDPAVKHDKKLHLQAPIEWNGTTIEVDEGIRGTIEGLLALCWVTTDSCEMLSDLPTDAYISFETYEGGRQFFDLVHRQVERIEWSNNGPERGVAFYFAAKDLPLIEGMVRRRAGLPAIAAEG